VVAVEGVTGVHRQRPAKGPAASRRSIAQTYCQQRQALRCRCESGGQVQAQALVAAAQSRYHHCSVLGGVRQWKAESG
jgi:hypothetical protein